MNRFILTILVVGAFVQAGCVGGDSKAGLDATSDAPGATGGVRGSVLSDELFPVIGANVSTPSGKSSVTDSGGRFELPLEAGDYELTVAAEGYEAASMKVEVRSDAFAEVRILVKGIPGQAPYKTTLIHTGFDACSFSGVYSAGPFPGGTCPFGVTDTRYRVEVSKDWAAGVHELAWLSSDNMAFASAVSTADAKHGLQRDGCAFTTVNGQTAYDWCPALISGRSPLRIYVRPNDTAYAKVHSINQKETWPGGENFTSRIFSSYAGYGRNELNSTAYAACAEVNKQVGFPAAWGCPFGVGYSTGIKITYYHTMFYLQAPAGRLEDFTALPDG